MKPTPEQVAAEIAALKEMKPFVRHRSIFGDDNHEAIDAQITTLECHLDDDAIYDRYQPIDEESGEPDESGNNRGELDAALEAKQWLRGEQDDAPSKEWAGLDSRK